MNYAVVNPQTKTVENIICADSSVVESIQNGSGMMIISADGYPLQISDIYNEEKQKFYRDGIEISGIPTIQEMVQDIIDIYTKELIDGGVL